LKRSSNCARRRRFGPVSPGAAFGAIAAGMTRKTRTRKVRVAAGVAAGARNDERP